MVKYKRLIFLYLGLLLMAVAFAAKYFFGAGQTLFLTLISIAIALKITFLAITFTQKKLTFTWPIKLILIGIATIIIAVIIKNTIQIEWLYLTFFYTAITLKTLGLILLIKEKL